MVKLSVSNWLYFVSICLCGYLLNDKVDKLVWCSTKMSPESLKSLENNKGHDPLTIGLVIGSYLLVEDNVRICWSNYCFLREGIIADTSAWVAGRLNMQGTM